MGIKLPSHGCPYPHGVRGTWVDEGWLAMGINKWWQLSSFCQKYPCTFSKGDQKKKALHELFGKQTSTRVITANSVNSGHPVLNKGN